MNKILTKYNDIAAWVEAQGITNYELIPDRQYGYAVNVRESVHLNEKNLTHFPIKFNEVHGGFYCISSKLKSLELGPTKVGNDFNCAYNKLTSLKGCPVVVGGSFLCNNNLLTSLKYIPKTIEVNCLVSDNLLKELKYGPEIVNGHYYCERNQLLSLEYIPQFIGNGLTLYGNDLLGKDKNISTYEELKKRNIEILIEKEKNLLTFKLPPTLTSNINPTDKTIFKL